MQSEGILLPRATQNQTVGRQKEGVLCVRLLLLYSGLQRWGSRCKGHGRQEGDLAMMERPDEEEAKSLSERAWRVRLTGSLRDARSIYLRALEQWTALGNQTAIAETLTKLGEIAMDLQEREEAETYLQQGAELWQRLGDWEGYTGCLRKLGRIARGEGRYADTEAWRNYRGRLYEWGREDWEDSLRRRRERG